MPLKGKKIAIFVEADYQDLELHYPRLRLIEEGAEVLIVGTGTASRYIGKYGYPVQVDLDAATVHDMDIDGIIIPGGWAPDKMRLAPKMVQLVQDINSSGKLIGCICHGGWLLASANILNGRHVTSYRAIRDDLVNAGAIWIDNEVVIDRNLITSRQPDDLPAFMREVIKALKE